MLRRGLLQSLYYYLLAAVTVIFFLCISSLNYLFDGREGWRSGLQSYDKGKAGEGLTLVVLLVYQLTGLLVIILFKRRQTHVGNPLFILLAALFIVGFVLPSLLFFITGLSMFSST